MNGYKDPVVSRVFGNVGWVSVVSRVSGGYSRSR